ncbi:TerD family protein [Cyanobacterium aponinum UTEX 3222]|uniref:Stress protein n=2 Tax=Cyanobacterium aponinum TaxID=379064 RepID=K9Z5I5_CYAAP|nr:TerD family protein [Cyanobacterium aponinum]WRL42041.1 TerD family protein [Cyanobacterium aponinum UTEX 3222]AFZ54002.1 stress protein [Cyanobacterium aponinum PCC 10605]MBD2395657.1 TerD family protein [Cyanobacterium aponinum FACHB-4101]PHV60983.1 stress protein [Cyanobacterium aponinum IPPAS B-1201]WPF89323.1 TerD family protein [Cyanobacterium aponinum AL20115]
MGINLQKGQRISLKKEAPKLEQLMCGLGWDVAKKKGGFLSGLFTTDFDLDASVLCLNQDGKIKSNSEIVFFGNLRHYSDAINHMGDNLTGAGDGDDEQILVKLPLIPQNIHKLVFVVNIYNALERSQDFSQVENAFVRLVNLSNNQEIARYTLSGNGYQGKTGMIMAEIARVGDDWEMMAKGEGFQVKSLGDVMKLYS